MTAACHLRVDSFDTWLSRDQVGDEVPNNFKHLSNGETLVRALPLLHCATSLQEINGRKYEHIKYEHVKRNNSEVRQRQTG
jgi:hypothetical protein